MKKEVIDNLRSLYREAMNKDDYSDFDNEITAQFDQLISEVEKAHIKVEAADRLGDALLECLANGFECECVPYDYSCRCDFDSLKDTVVAEVKAYKKTVAL